MVHKSRDKLYGLYVRNNFGLKRSNRYNTDGDLVYNCVWEQFGEIQKLHVASFLNNTV